MSHEMDAQELWDMQKDVKALRERYNRSGRGIDKTAWEKAKGKLDEIQNRLNQERKRRKKEIETQW